MIDFYDNFAPYYDAWVSHDILATELTQFYSDIISNTDSNTHVVYLGIATGRIAIEISKNNPYHHIIGIDSSHSMLQKCHNTFKNISKLENITLLNQDILKLKIDTQNNIYIMPFRTIGHFITLKQKEIALISIHKTMQKDELLIFDFDLLDELSAKKTNNQPHLSYHDETNGTIIYNKFNFNFVTQEIDVTVYQAIKKEEKLEDLVQHHYKFSWCSEAQIIKIVTEIGFKVINIEHFKMNRIFTLQK